MGKKTKKYNENEIVKEIDELKNTMKKDSNERKQILKEVSLNMDSYSNKVIDYEYQIKELDMIKIKYKNLERELQENNKIYREKIKEYEEKISEYSNEVQIDRRLIIKFKNKSNFLFSLIDQVINKYGIDDISNITGISVDKIKEYLQD
ncbi:MAG: hypothetical protein ACK5HP_00385 [Bacilli bacterium]